MTYQDTSADSTQIHTFKTKTPYPDVHVYWDAERDELFISTDNVPGEMNVTIVDGHGNTHKVFAS